MSTRPGDILYLLRKELNETQADVAKAVGLPTTTINRYENHTTLNIPKARAELIANHFGVSPCYLLGWSENRSININRDNNGDIVTEDNNNDLSMEENELLKIYRELKGFKKIELLLEAKKLQEPEND